jgi:nucleoside phosphorylase
MRIGTEVRRLARAETEVRAPDVDAWLVASTVSCGRADAGAAPAETRTSVESETATAESALAAENVRVVVMAGTVGGVSNRPATDG